VNLLTNAVKFSENNSKICIDYEIIEEYVKIKIIDFGAGIPEQYLDRIFDKFVQSEMRKLGITQSTGLGLTFSKLAMLAHNQQIGVISHIHKGSTFWFGLKLVKTSDNIIPKKNKRKIIQTNDEITTIKKELKNLKYYETGEIFTVLSNKDFSSDEFLKWKQEIEKATLLSNESYYNKLIK
jgi:DNA topoisomerase VI subunit B